MTTLRPCSFPILNARVGITQVYQRILSIPTPTPHSIIDYYYSIIILVYTSIDIVITSILSKVYYIKYQS